MKEKNSAFKAGRTKNQIISLAVVAALIFLTFYTLYNSIEDLDFRGLCSIFLGLDKKYVMLALLFMAGFVIIEGACIAALARALGYRVGFASLAVYSASDIYFSAITPSATGGQPASAYYMAKDGMKVSHATTILIVNILLYTISLIIMGLWAVAVKFRFFMGAGKLFQILFFVGIGLQAALVGLCLLCMFSKDIIKRAGHWGVNLLFRLKLLKSREEKLAKIDESIGRYQSGMRFIRKKPGLMAAVLGGNVLQRIAFFSIGWFIYRSFGLSQAGYGEFLAMQSLLAMAVNSLPVPGAIGISEGSFLFLFQSVFPAGILAPAMIITRGMNYYLCFILCGVYTLIYHLRILKSKRMSKEEIHE